VGSPLVARDGPNGEGPRGGIHHQWVKTGA
jgi:hypothetical protein